MLHCNLKRSRRTVIFLPVYKIPSLKITPPKTLQLKTLDFLQQTITMNENAQWQMIEEIRCYSLSVWDFPFHCFIFIWKKNRLEVYCSVFLLFSRCIDHFICYSRIVYIGDNDLSFNLFPVGSHVVEHFVHMLEQGRYVLYLFPLNALYWIQIWILFDWLIDWLID
jgi:hypothetical protein